MGAGGTERQLVYLLERLDRDRFECHVLTTYDQFRHYEPTLNQLGIPLYSLHHGDLRPIRRARAVARYVRLMGALRPDIVHGWLHYPNLIARAARPLCPPHRLITAIRSEYSARERRSERLTARLSDFRIVMHEGTGMADITGRTTPIKNGVDLINFERNTQPDLRSNLFASASFIFLLPARIDPHKDHLTFFEALHKSQHQQDLKAVLIGEITSPETQQQINTAIERYNLQSLITQLPATHDLAPYYHAADVTVLPSMSEGFPNVILESFAAGKPVIVSEAANRSGVVRHGINGWIFPTGDSDALAECLNAAWETSASVRTIMGERGRAVAAEYSLERMVEQYTQLYERALNKR